MSIFPKNLISVDDLNPDQIATLMDLSSKVERSMKKKEQFTCMNGSVLASLFFEPSTRTRLSFETAMLRLGGLVTSVTGGVSSLEKGESLKDMARVVSCYSDFIVMRHPNQGSVREFAETAEVPLINAGDGSSEHPTQALLDLYTILKFHKRINGLTFGCVGDLKYGRAARSIVKLLSKFGVHFVFISHKDLSFSQEVKDLILKSGSSFEESDDLKKSIKNLNVLYMTRIQRERFENLHEYEKLKSLHTLTSHLLTEAPRDMSILHPLPRVSEISEDVDCDSRAKYFEQVSSGLYVRMSLLILMSGKGVSL